MILRDTETVTETTELAELLPETLNTGNAALVWVAVKNTGTAGACLRAVGDTATDAPFDIPAGCGRFYGPFSWPGGVPELYLEVDANCLVQFITEGQP